MPQDPVTLDDFRRFGNIPEAYRALLGRVGAVMYRGTPFGEVPRAMATASRYEEEVERQRQEGEHALLGLALAHDLPAEILAFRDKPDVDVRYPDGTPGGVEVVRIVYEPMKRSDSHSAAIGKALKEAIGSSSSRGYAMAGRHVVVVHRGEPRTALRRKIVHGVLAWIDQGFPGTTSGEMRVLAHGQRALDENDIEVRIGTVAGTGWEVTVGTAIEDVQPMDIVDSVQHWLGVKRHKSDKYRYTSGLRLVMPIVGFHPEPLVVRDLARLRSAQIDFEPFVRVIVYRDLDFAVLERT